MNPSEYTGKEWDDLLRAMSARDIKRALKTAYRRIGKQIADIARSDLASSGLRHGSKMKSSVRVHVYSRGGGFEVTVTPHGRQGYYKRSQDGQEKPVAMWANSGTVERKHRKTLFPVKGGFKNMKSGDVGRMPALNFLSNARNQAYPIIRRGMDDALNDAIEDRLRKAGWI